VDDLVLRARLEEARATGMPLPAGKDLEYPDWDAYLAEATQVGQAACTNNDYGIKDYYYSEYVEPYYASWQDRYSNWELSHSKEYDDLELFLRVCQESDIDPLIIIVPVNGPWYDYTGFKKSERDDYYQRIRTICDNYNVEYADFSDKEYETYFLGDAMHLGWRGWVYVEQAIYNFKQGSI
jgi:D-alanine transfer protein